MIAFYLFTTTKLNWLKVFCVIAGFVNLFGLNFTQNRTAFPAIIAGAIIYLFTTIKTGVPSGSVLEFSELDFVSSSQAIWVSVWEH